jgi:hypothetical protein
VVLTDGEVGEELVLAWMVKWYPRMVKRSMSSSSSSHSSPGSPILRSPGASPRPPPSPSRSAGRRSPVPSSASAARHGGDAAGAAAAATAAAGAREDCHVGGRPLERGRAADAAGMSAVARRLAVRQRVEAHEPRDDAGGPPLVATRGRRRRRTGVGRGPDLARAELSPGVHHGAAVEREPRQPPRRRGPAGVVL